MDELDFEKVVRDTLDSLPIEFKSKIENIEIVIEDIAIDESGKPNPHLLGLYHGVPLTERGSTLLPDKISIYKVPILSRSKDEHDAKKHIRDTVLHEIGHYFGMSDEELEKLKY